MHKGVRIGLIWLGVSTLLAIGVGLVFGYLNKHYLGSLVVAFGISYTIWVFNALVGIFLGPKLTKLPRNKRLRLQIPCLLVTNISAFLLMMFIFGKLFGFNIFVGKTLLLNLMVWFIIALIIFGLAYSISSYKELKERDIAEERLKSLTAKAELKALKAQINPHFLFNTLNMITNLISINPQKAEETTQKLADIFRYTLSSSNKEFVTLKEELNFIDSFLEISKARFGDKLKVEKYVEPDVMETSVPALILQPIVENAIKHGMGVEDDTIRIDIIAYRKKDIVKIEIKDQGRGIPTWMIDKLYEKGTGLRNVNDRLRRIYGSQHGLEIKENTPKGTVVILKIPQGNR